MNLFDQKIANSVCRSELESYRELFPVDRNKIALDQLIWCANEVQRQQDGPLDVPQMVDAYNYARFYFDGEVGITVKDVLFLGYLVDREENSGGFRRHQVFVGAPWNMKLDWEKVPRQLPLLVAAQHDMEPTNWYREFEEIHPFADGNGRVGSILWNHLRGSIETPEYPPDVYDDDFFTAQYQEYDTFD